MTTQSIAGLFEPHEIQSQKKNQQKQEQQQQQQKEHEEGAIEEEEEMEEDKEKVRMDKRMTTYTSSLSSQWKFQEATEL